jgi:hypothetical protein
VRSIEKINRLFDYAVSHPDGFTYVDIQADLRWRRKELLKVVKGLRSLLGSIDQINLVCDPTGPGQPWSYRLVGTVKDAQPWTANRLGDAETRLTTIRSVASSIAAGTDGRTTDGKRARLIKRALTRLLEDLADVNGQLF